jgi:hypothetical protein
MNRSLVRSAIAVTGVVAGVMTWAAPASATWYSCSVSYACLWSNAKYDGGPWFEEKNLGRYNTGWVHNDVTSSVANRSGHNSLNLYNNTNTGTGDGVACVPRNYSAPDLKDYGWGDRISSVRIFTGACPDGVKYIGGPRTK